MKHYQHIGDTIIIDEDSYNKLIPEIQKRFEEVETGIPNYYSAEDGKSVLPIEIGEDYSEE